MEIKEFTPNEEEKQAIRDLEEKQGAVWGSTRVGNRVRYKIDGAKRQLERLAAERCPAVLVLYDARPIPIRGISPYEIEVAMYGWETIDLHVPDKLGEPVRFGKHRFGKGQKLRPDCHTYISAVGVLRETSPDERLHLDLYHNVFADVPMPLEALVSRSDITMFTIAPGEGNEFRGWARVVPDREGEEAVTSKHLTEGVGRLPLVSLAVFSCVCLALACLARTIQDLDAAMRAVAAVGGVFFLGLLVFQGHSGWARQRHRPRRVESLCLQLVVAVVAVLAATLLHQYVHFRSWHGLPVSLLGVWGILKIASTVGALLHRLTAGGRPQA